jgi:cytochrome c oxidase accessory protein FixG
LIQQKNKMSGAEGQVGDGQKKDESFRDTVNTIGELGGRNWIFPKKPKGKLYKARTIVTAAYLLIFFSLPFIKVNGNPLFLINILERKFIIFGAIFWPQDFIIFGIGMIAFIVFIVLFTIAFGRAFCGWACPQTVFMEMVFRKIEYWIDGDAEKQRKLAKQPWTKEKITKRTVKWTVFYLISVLIANTFLAYVIGADQVIKIISEPIDAHIGGFIGMLIFSGVFFGVFAWFREQVCLIVCPYGRLQGVMLDRDSIVVAYDYVRGEPREMIRKNVPSPAAGDCIDCSLCVKVCPTGIDIRNGTQLECVNCTACIDACDHVMEKTNRPKGLIRFDSENGIKNKTPLRFTARLKAYSAVLLILIGVLSYLLISRSAIDVTVFRASGQLFQEKGTNEITNLYTVSVINKTHTDVPVTFRIESGDGSIQMIGKNLVVPAESKGETTFFIIRERENIGERKTKIKISAWCGNIKLQTVSTSFLGPIYRTADVVNTDSITDTLTQSTNHELGN